jgi:acid phosphatase (class A)
MTLSSKLRSKLVALSIGIAMLGAAHAADPDPFINGKDLALVEYLPRPPADDSMQTGADLQQVLSIQQSRTPEMCAIASADVVQDVWRFTSALPPELRVRFNQQALPTVDAFFDRVKATKNAVLDPAKDTWKRARPFKFSSQVRPCIKLEDSASYPSGHATASMLMAIVLSDMLPEYREAIMQRAIEYAQNRVIGGVHYPSDIIAGRTSGALIALELKRHAEFNEQFALVKAQLRSALQLY